MKAFSKVEFYDRVLWKNYLAVIGIVGTIVTLISFFVTAEDIDRFSTKQLAAFLVAGLVLIFSVMWYSANHRKHAVKMINNTIVRIAEGDIFELLERDPDKRIGELSVIGANDFYDTLVDDRIVARKTNQESRKTEAAGEHNRAGRFIKQTGASSMCAGQTSRKKSQISSGQCCRI